MADYPIEFDGTTPVPTVAARTAAPVATEIPIPTFTVEPAVPAPAVTVAPAVAARIAAPVGQETHRFILVTLNGWPEVKTEWELQCKKVLGQNFCIKIPRVYRRTCHVVVYVDVSYPSGAVQDITQCIIGASLVTAIAAILAHGQSAVSVFKAALSACLKAKGKAWAQNITVIAGSTSQCGGWSPV